MCPGLVVRSDILNPIIIIIIIIITAFLLFKLGFENLHGNWREYLVPFRLGKIFPKSLKKFCIVWSFSTIQMTTRNPGYRGYRKKFQLWGS